MLFYLTVSTGHTSIEQQPIDCINHLGRELDAHLVEGPVSWSIRVDDLPGQHMGRVDAAETAGRDDIIQEHLDHILHNLQQEGTSQS